MKLANKVLLVLYLCLGLAGTGITAGVYDICYSPFTISQSGSYLVVADLTTGQDLNCITIQANDVTIDLNGHTLYGAGTTVGSTGDGIYSNLNSANIAVYNGTVRDFRGRGIYLFGFNHQVNRIRSYANGNNGIYIQSNGTVWDNTVRNNGGIGILTGVGAVVRDNSVRENGGAGIAVSTLCLVTDNTSILNGSDGIFANNGSTVTKNCVSSNTAHGINATFACTIIGNTALANGNKGIVVYASCLIKDNTVHNNYSDGIEVEENSIVVGNTCGGNGYSTGDGAGINVYSSGSDNLIANNLVTDNDRGIDCNPATGNRIESNRASGNTTDFDIIGGNSVGAGDLVNVAF